MLESDALPMPAQNHYTEEVFYIHFGKLAEMRIIPNYPAMAKKKT
jgi:hypothetical protein